MRKFRRQGIVITSQLSPDEVMLLQSLIAQLVAMIGDDEDDADPDLESDMDPDVRSGPVSPGSVPPGSLDTAGPGRVGAASVDPAAGDPAPDEADPFEAWAREFEAPQSTAPPEDPAVRRLFPDAYPGDAEASADFRRYTERGLRDKKVGDAQVALQHLALTDQGRQELRIPRDDIEPWLRTFTSLRLAVAARLGIENAEVAEALADLPDEDPRAWLASVYDWLGFAQETLLAAL